MPSSSYDLRAPRICAVLFLATSFVSASAFAQPAAPAAPPPTDAKAGSTSQHTEKAVDPAATAKSEEKDPDGLVWTVNVTGSLATGNTRSLTLGANTRLFWREELNSVTVDGQFLYGEAAPRVDGTLGPREKNAELYFGRARYDRFLTTADALFAAASALRNTFAGLDSRLQGQLGYLHDFLAKDNHRLWTETGYDLTLDNYYPNPLITPETMERQPNTATVHSIRVFAGYDNRLSEDVSFLTGLEGLFNVERAKDIRVNWISELNVKVFGDFQTGVQFTVRFDNEPVPTYRRFDTLTMLTLGYVLDTTKKEPPAEEPPPSEETPVAEPATSDEPPPENAPTETEPPAGDAAPEGEAAPAEPAPAPTEATPAAPAP